MPDLLWKPEEIIHYPLIEHVHLAPDGQQVLFTTRTAYLTDKASEFRNQIVMAPTAGGEARPLTFGEAASSPRWSPDGRYIAFLRKLPTNGKVGLWVMRANGGEAWPLTGVDNGIHNDVTMLSWSPDGQRLALISVPYDEAKEQRRNQRDDALHWRIDYDFPHLFVAQFVEANRPLPPVVQLTRGRFCVLNLDWSPDGARIAFTHRPTPLMDTWPQSRLATIASTGDENEPLDLGATISVQASLAYAPNNQWIACDIGTAGASWAYASRVMLFPATGGDPVPLAHVSDEQPRVVGWKADSRAVYALNQTGLTSQLAALPVDGGDAQVLIDGEGQFEVVHVNAAGQAALSMQNFTEINRVCVVDLTSQTAAAALRKLAPPVATHYPQGPLPQVKTLHWRTPDDFEIEGILYLPHDYDEQSGMKLPLLLHIHGGPAGVFQRQFAGYPYYYTPAALCELGIAVFRCNPRGSGGYGKQFRAANMRDWGGGDYRDIQQGVDEVLAMGIADPARLGICGWSYGGFMASWTITQTNRFVAASIGAPVTNPTSFNGTSDIPGFIPNYFGVEAWEDPAFYAAHSPIAHVQNVQTPAIIQHGDADVRVPLEQGLQFYNAMHRRGVPVEMYIYPRHGHALSEPRLLADAARRNLEWFAKMLLQSSNTNENTPKQV
ncbi:MAG: S9 family peptidase [Chloroflexi bacterium]|nr:S9 family peptidase [Chloroflexota bacterium]